MINIWENKDGCVEKYLCVTALYLLSILTYEYNIIIDGVVGETGHEREVFDGLNATYKSFISMLMITIQLPGAEDYE